MAETLCLAETLHCDYMRTLCDAVTTRPCLAGRLLPDALLLPLLRVLHANSAFLLGNAPHRLAQSVRYRIGDAAVVPDADVWEAAGLVRATMDVSAITSSPDARRRIIDALPHRPLADIVDMVEALRADATESLARACINELFERCVVSELAAAVGANALTEQQAALVWRVARVAGDMRCQCRDDAFRQHARDALVPLFALLDVGDSSDAIGNALVLIRAAAAIGDAPLMVRHTVRLFALRRDTDSQITVSEWSAAAGAVARAGLQCLAARPLIAFGLGRLRTFAPPAVALLVRLLSLSGEPVHDPNMQLELRTALERATPQLPMLAAASLTRSLLQMPQLNEFDAEARMALRRVVVTARMLVNDRRGGPQPRSIVARSFVRDTDDIARMLRMLRFCTMPNSDFDDLLEIATVSLSARIRHAEGDLACNPDFRAHVLVLCQLATTRNLPLVFHNIAGPLRLIAGAVTVRQALRIVAAMEQFGVTDVATTDLVARVVLPAVPTLPVDSLALLAHAVARVPCSERSAVRAACADRLEALMRGDGLLTDTDAVVPQTLEYDDEQIRTSDEFAWAERLVGHPS